ncbi:MAG: Chromate resistance protein ChrB, partial [Chloroflexota bacterium]
GTAITLAANGLTEDDERALAMKFEGARHDDYRQVIKSARKFIAHVDQEDRSHDYRFAEVESLEEELNKVRRQLTLVRDRDTLRMPLGDEAIESVTAAEARLQQYLDHAYQEENIE